MTQDPSLAIDRPIVLVGLMATGKSRLGRDLALALGLKLIDTDTLIEQDAGMSVSEIFAAEGQQGFRDREARMIARVLGKGVGPCIVSTGGGAILRSENADIIFGDTISIWVKASIETLVGRTANRTDRPLLQNADSAKVLSDMAEIRYPIYSRADITVSTDSVTPEESLAFLLQKITG